MEKGADRRRENLPVADEIALLILGKEDKPGSREVILTARPARDTPNQVEPLHRISYTHPLSLLYNFIPLEIKAPPSLAEIEKDRKLPSRWLR
jgi:hypothetical protein